MPKFINCSDGFLFKKGAEPIIMWSIIGLGGYLLVLIFHKPIVGKGNIFIALLWAASTLWLLIYWIKSGDRIEKMVYKKLFGFIGEWRISRVLKYLPDNYFVLCDVLLPGLKGNIDFIIVCSYGVFTIEVKNLKAYIYNIWDNWRNRGNFFQAQKEAEVLYRVLGQLDFNSGWVRSLLVFANQRNYSPMINGNVHVLGRESVVWYFDNLSKQSERKFSDEKIEKIAFLIRDKSTRNPKVKIMKN